MAFRVILCGRMREINYPEFSGFLGEGGISLTG
jgi:hypothetical protein